MKKSYILLAVLIIIILVALGGGGLIIYSITTSKTPVITEVNLKKNDNSETNTLKKPNIQDDSKDIILREDEKIVTQENQDKQAILLNPDNSISLINSDGKNILLTIDTAFKKDIQINIKKNILSILREENPDSNIFNIWLYNLENDEFKQMTFFDKQGINSYKWLNDEVILFNQGIGINNWLHTNNIYQENSITKISRIDGDIHQISPDKTKLLYKLNSPANFGVFNLEGDLLWLVDKLYFENELNTKNYLNEIKNIIWGLDSNKLYVFANNITFKTAVNQDRVFKLKIQNAINPICSSSKNEFIGYYTDEDEKDIKFVKLNDTEEKADLLKFFDFNQHEEIITKNIKCDNDGLFINSIFNNAVYWFYSSEEEESFEEIVYARNSLEIIKLQ